MRVLYILHTSDIHGSTISFINMVSGLVKMGVEPIVLIPKEGSSIEIEEMLNQAGVQEYYKTTIVLSWIKPFSPHSFLDFLRITYQYFILFYKKIRSFFNIFLIVLKRDPDIIHTNVSIVQEGYIVSKVLKIPHIFHIREYYDNFNKHIVPSKKVIEKRLKKSHASVTITDGLKEYFNLKNCPNAYTIYNGIFNRDDTCFNMTKAKYFISACRIDQEKGIEDLIYAFSLFSKSHSDYQLIIAGNGNEGYIQYLNNMAETLNIKENVKIIGFRKDVPSLLSRGKALLVGSPHEPFGRMTAEAAFCGCLVIGRNTGGTKEIIEKTGGLLFNKVNELSKIMEEVAEMDEKEYESIVLSAQKKAKDLFSNEKNANNIYSLYNSILKKN